MRTKRAFEVKFKPFFNVFKRILASKYCLRLESTPLMIKFLTACFDELEDVKCIKKIKTLMSLQVKAEAYLETKRVSMMELFCENSKPLTAFAKKSIIDVRLGSKYASESIKILKTNLRWRKPS